MAHKLWGLKNSIRKISERIRQLDKNISRHFGSRFLKIMKSLNGVYVSQNTKFIIYEFILVDSVPSEPFWVTSVTSWRMLTYFWDRDVNVHISSVLSVLRNAYHFRRIRYHIIVTHIDVDSICVME